MITAWAELTSAAQDHRADPCCRSGLTFFNTEIRVKTWAEFYKFGLQAMPARIRGLNVLALLVGISKAVSLQMFLGLTLEGCACSHRDHWLPIILPEGVMGGCYGRCADDSKKFQLG